MMKEITKKFIAENTNAALKQVKAELGQDALIISYEIINGKTHVIAAPASAQDMVAGSDLTHSFDALLSRRKTKQNSENHLYGNYYTESKFSTKLLVGAPEKNATQHYQSEGLFNHIVKELEVIHNQLKTNESEKQHSHYDNVLNKLLLSGFSFGLIERVLSDLPRDLNYENTWHYVIDKMISLLLIDSHYLISSRNIKSFVGPSGSGKTQLIVKTILKLLEINKKASFAFIFVNHSNIKTYEESLIYSKIFDTTSYYVESLDELEFAFKKALNKDFLFIDCPSYDFACYENNFHVHFLLKMHALIDNTLVISASASASHIDRYVQLYRGIKMDGISITKIDESDDFEGVIDYAICQKIPIRNLISGQDVTTELQEVNKEYFLKHYHNKYLGFDLEKFSETRIQSNPMLGVKCR